MYSTGPGQVAADNPDGKNSWFTESLSTLIGQPGLSMDEVFNRVKRQVQDETGGKQTPWVSSTLTSTFYFHPVNKPDAQAELTLTAKRMEDAKRFEQAEEWDQAIETLKQVLAKKPGPGLEAAAQSKLPYLVARRDARVKFEASDFPAAAVLYGDALKQDPFAIEAAFEGVKSYLLADRLPDAVKLLEAVRVRGTSECDSQSRCDAQGTGRPVYPDAGKQLQAGIPQPPPIEEVFRGTTFGVPDWDAGARYLLPSALDVQALIKGLPEMPAPTVPPAPSLAAGTTAKGRRRQPCPDGVLPCRDPVEFAIARPGDPQNRGAGTEQQRRASYVGRARQGDHGSAGSRVTGGGGSGGTALQIAVHVEPHGREARDQGADPGVPARKPDGNAGRHGSGARNRHAAAIGLRAVRWIADGDAGGSGRQTDDVPGSSEILAGRGNV